MMLCFQEYVSWRNSIFSMVFNAFCLLNPTVLNLTIDIDYIVPSERGSVRREDQFYRHKW